MRGLLAKRLRLHLAVAFTLSIACAGAFKVACETKEVDSCKGNLEQVPGLLLPTKGYTMCTLYLMYK
ncbi:hypothetical protein scyTo_0006549 [Scyliorhinus torazame]|uniref:Uncharacterized protein n=1 Tax=Scyliorhinus torazame TaxID=75743 RepID=A0A401PII2_SCYTO|nr:hypothetical protein [Scyliorhinus torazame]